MCRGALLTGQNDGLLGGGISGRDLPGEGNYRGVHRGELSSTSRYFWPIMTPSPATPCHTSRNPPFLLGLVQKSRAKAPCTNSLSIVREGFCQGAFFRGAFVWKLLSE